MSEMLVLVGDAHVCARRGVRAVLERHLGAVIVGETDDGPTLVATAARSLPTLVVIDLTLNRLGGVQVLSQIRQANRGVRLMVLTADTTERSLLAAFDAGANGYVLKQSPIDVLVEAASALTAGRLFVDPAMRLLRFSQPHSADALSVREQRVVALVAAGYGNKEIAAMLGISLKTTETDRANAVRKLGTRERPEWLRHAMQQGWFAQYVATV